MCWQTIELITELSEDQLNALSDNDEDYTESTDSNLSSISESVGMAKNEANALNVICFVLLSFSVES